MEPDTDERRRRLVTIDQIVAWNFAWYRKQAQMTQREVGDLLGWPENKVSEAERSWSGKRTREFNAQLIADLGAVFGIPVMAFFLPPLDDPELLFFPAPDGDPRPMTDLMWLAMHDNDGDGLAMAAYRSRFRVQAHQYLDPEWFAQAIGGFAELGEKEAVEEQMATLRAVVDMGRNALAELERIAGGAK